MLPEIEASVFDVIVVAATAALLFLLIPPAPIV